MQAGPDYAEGLINKMRTVIRRNPHQGDAHETTQPATFGQRLRRALPGSHRPDRSGLHSPPSGTGSSVLATTAGWANKRPFLPIVIAIFAALAVILSLWLSGVLVQAQSAQMVVPYPENGEGPVATFTASDPEGVSPIVWSLLEDHMGDQDLGIFTDSDTDGADDSADDVGEDDVADFDDFDISQDGVLTFKSKPNYEVPTSSITTGTLPVRNVYQIVVQASDGGSMSFVNWFKVTVNVTDMEEAGSVTWTVDADGGDSHTAGTPTLLQFQPGASLQGTASDGDAPVTNVRWQWYRSASKTAMGTAIDGATSGTYTVSDTSGSNDVGMYVRAVATYSDNRGPNKTADLVSEYPVQQARDDNTVPKFATTNQTREIVENSKGNIGAPITATDADGDVLNYSKAAGGAENALFDIDQKTGQLSVAAGTTLDFEAAAPNDNEHVVTIMATDSSGGDSSAVTVTITVTDENEKPVFPAGLTEPNPAPGTQPDHAENTDSLAIGTFTATDPEDGEVTLSLEGADKGKFELNNRDPVVAGSKVLAFNEKPDFETPGDSNTDNIYEVTVRASDGEMYADRKVTVKVTDSDESGMVDLSAQDALIGVELTATFKDSDGGVPTAGTFTDVVWSWHRLEAETVEAAAAIEATDANAINLAKSNTYTPVAADRGRYLKAMASYTDRTRDENNVDTDNTADANFIGFTNTATSDATTAVRNNPQNQRPVFAEGTRTARVVEENTKALTGATGEADADDDELADDTADNPADNVGGTPIVATDADGDGLTYTLSGSDAGMFRVRQNGQLEVSGKASLDYERSRSHTVTLTADDGFGASNSAASITVTIHVTNLDEAPTIGDKGDAAAIGEQVIPYAENGTGPVISLKAADPEGVRTIVWSFLMDAGGDQNLGIFTDSDTDGEDDSADDVGTDDIADRGDFDISQDGVLTFDSKPNFETPVDANTDNEYRVVVQASDGGLTNKLSWFKVTVNVTDIEEPGSVTWTVDPDGAGNAEAGQELLQFNANAILTAANPTDGDGNVANVAWQWYRSTSKTATGTAISSATSATYAVLDSPSDPNDVGKYLRVIATYSDQRGPDKTAELVSEYPVQAVREATNQAPAFTTTTVPRRTAENSTGNIGAPVTANDPDDDVVNYVITGSGADNGSFAIDQKTGQLKVGADTTLNFEDPNDQGDTPDNNTYVVTVVATDSSGRDSVPATVTITVTDENEKPVFPAGQDPLNPASGAQADHAENNETLAIGTFTATDPEEGEITLSLEGADKGKFELNDPDTVLAGRKVLAFNEKPDFETPGDSNRDNIYEVTVRASDGEMYADRKVTVKVTDSDEGGMADLSAQDALTGVELTATLKDSDGGVPTAGTFTDVVWSWHRMDDPANAASRADDGNAIPKADSDTYSPVRDDIGMYLKAMVSYTDRTRDENNVDTDNTADANFVGFTNTATSDATTAVRDNPKNQRPVFAEGTRTARVVEENTKALTGATGEADADDDELADDTADNPADNVGGRPVMATDADSEDTLTYTLGGADASMFRVRQNGQLEVSSGASLDHETEDEHTVIVTATDSSSEANNSASITVTIHVTDLDERPVIVATGGGLVITGPSGPSRAEGVGGEVGRYSVSGGDGGTPSWSLTGNDAGDFRINQSGVVTFRTAPDYESPADANRDNSYTFTVNATVGDESVTRPVTVSVTNEDEDGMVRISPRAPGVGTTLTASVTDLDGGVTNERWQWARGAGSSYVDIAGATDETYVAVADDAGNYLRATVRYDDAAGRGRSEEDVTANAVGPAASLLSRYDTSGNGEIEKLEYLAALDLFLDRDIEKPELLEVLDLHLDSLL